MAEVLGVDIGGVIISHDKVAGIYPPLPDAFEVLKRLREERFGENIFLVSHADEDLSLKMIDWLVTEEFGEKTGIGYWRICFCRQRKQKADICLKHKITHFIDDRKEVMLHLRGAKIKNLYLFQRRSEEDGLYQHVLSMVTKVNSWKEVSKVLLGS